ncbi:MAG: hypothetical protein Rubg2KO_23710 [Rubricoccaceae bacterium]
MDMIRPLAFLCLLVALAACGDDVPDLPDSETVLVLEADVERFRTDVFLETTEIDAEIAQFEGEAVGADSATAAAYADALSRLHRTRRTLQARVDSLRPVPAVVFDSTRQSILDQTEGLWADIDRARFDVALTGVALQSTARRAVAQLDPVFEALRADTTARASRQLDSLTVWRGQLNDGLDTLRRVPDERVDAARLIVLDALTAFRQEAEAVAPDSLDL